MGWNRKGMRRNGKGMRTNGKGKIRGGKELKGTSGMGCGGADMGWSGRVWEGTRI